MNKVSHCCHDSIVDGIQREYPLGGKTWGIAYKVKVCDKCGKECRPVDACDICGEVDCKEDCVTYLAFAKKWRHRVLNGKNIAEQMAVLEWRGKH